LNHRLTIDNGRAQRELHFGCARIGACVKLDEGKASATSGCPQSMRECASPRHERLEEILPTWPFFHLHLASKTYVLEGEQLGNFLGTTGGCASCR
jgi:hypothetical protein